MEITLIGALVLASDSGGNKLYKVKLPNKIIHFVEAETHEGAVADVVPGFAWEWCQRVWVTGKPSFVYHGKDASVHVEGMD